MLRKSVLTLLLIGIVALLAATSTRAMGERAPQAPAPPVVTQTACNNCVEELRGKLVYERPNGIYWHPLGADQSTLLHRNGSWPRWSPDGQSVGFVVGKRIMLKRVDDGITRQLATVEEPRAVAFFADGRRLAYTNGNRVEVVDIDSGKTTTLLKGRRFLEIDLSDDGRFLAATIKRLGYSVWWFDLFTGKKRKIAAGCSASLSPDGKLITNLVDGHKQLLLRDTPEGTKQGRISSPPGLEFDNQNWSNHPDWLTSISEGKTMRVYAHHVPTDQAFPVGVDRDSDRPDLFVEP